MKKFSRERLVNIAISILIVLYLLLCGVVWKYTDLKTALLMISIPINILYFLYIKSDKAYLLISKYILRPYFMASNDWKFIGKITNVENFKIPDRNEITSLIKDVEIVDKLSIKKYQVNRYSIDYDGGKINFTIEYDPKKREVKVQTNKFTATDLNYLETLKLIYEVLKIIKVSLEGKLQESYDLIIYYKENPYYGFYLKQIPKKFIRKFSLNLTFPSSKSNIQVNKNKIQISAGDFEYLRDSAVKVLELSELPAHH